MDRMRQAEKERSFACFAVSDHTFAAVEGLTVPAPDS